MSNTERQAYPVVIDAGNDMTEIVVVDGRFQKIASGLRRLELQLPTGLYLVKTRVGQATRERFLSVPDQLALIDTLEDTPATSVTPLLAGSDWQPEEMSAESALRSRAPFPGLGEGIASVFVRDPVRHDAPPDEVALRDLNGRRLIRLGDTDEVAGSRVIGRGPITGFSIRLPAGGYLLQSRARNINTVGMALWVSAGFETRVYLERRLVSSVDKEGKADRRRTADLSCASIVMVRPGVDISVGEAAECVRISEMARATLAVERPIFPRDVIVQHLERKFDYPTVGILGAHLLALQPSPDVGLLTAVAGNLETVIPGHPDVTALRRFLHERNCPPIDCPPMLRASWSIIAAAAASELDVIAQDSVVAWIGSRVTAARPWLIWNGAARRARAYDESVDGKRVSDVIEALRAQASRYQKTGATSIAPGEQPDPAVMGSRLASSCMEALRDVEQFERDPLSELSERLNLPRSTVANELLDLTIEE